MNIKVMFEILELIFLHLDLSSYCSYLPYIFCCLCAMPFFCIHDIV